MRRTCCVVKLAFGLALGLLFPDSTHAMEAERNNWVVLVDTSRYWYNYRHVANVLTFYHTVKRLGIPDSQIILMLGEDMACNARNPKAGMVFNEMYHKHNLYGEQVEVDYRGDEVSVENFIRLLTGRHPPSTARSKRLLTDSMSNVFIYITGHSGEEFIKFQDWEELTSNDIADAFGQMHKQRRYNNIFWVSDTCQASTLQNQFYSPGIIAIGSSGKKENSYSHHIDPELGTAVIDRFTFYAFDFLKRLTASSNDTVQQFLEFFDPNQLRATPELRSDLYPTSPSVTPMAHFLASTGRMRFLESLMSVGRDAAISNPKGQSDSLCMAPRFADITMQAAPAPRWLDVQEVANMLSERVAVLGSKSSEVRGELHTGWKISSRPLSWHDGIGPADSDTHFWLLVCLLLLVIAGAVL